MSGANPGNVAGGHKANLKNPHTSEESKEHSRQVLRELEGGAFAKDVDLTPPSANDETPAKETNRVLGGYKSTLTNDATSEEAKEHAREVLHEHGVDA